MFSYTHSLIMTVITVLGDVTEPPSRSAIWMIESNVCIAVCIWMFVEGARDTTAAKHSYTRSYTDSHTRTQNSYTQIHTIALTLTSMLILQNHYQTVQLIEMNAAADPRSIRDSV